MRALKLVAAYAILGVATAAAFVVVLFVVGRPWQLLDWADRYVSGGADV